MTDDGTGPEDRRGEAAADGPSGDPATADTPAVPAPEGGLPEASAPRPFSLEGRSAPGLYFVGWIATIMGLAVVLVAVLAGGGVAAGWLLAGGLAVLSVGLVAAAGAQGIERSRRSGLSYAGPSPWLVFAAVIPITLLALIVILAPLSRLGLDPVSPLGTAIGLALTAAVYAGLVRLLVVGTGALSWTDMGLRLPASAAVRDVILGMLFGLPVLFVTAALALVLASFLEVPASPLPEAYDPVGIAANLVSAAILAPVGEELFFRGFATTAWARALGERSAIVRGALFFSFAHVVTLFDVDFAAGAERALFAFVVRLPVAFMLGWLFLSRRSLYAAIGLHAAFNGIQVLALAAQG